MNFGIKKYSEEELREYISKNDLTIDDWDDISDSQDLSEDFIRDFSDKVQWCSISWNQTLSDNFILEFKDKVLWGGISRTQDTSLKFKYLMHDKIFIQYVPNIKGRKNPKDVL